MKVYKFGGASVRNAEGVRNLRNIIDDEQNLFIIVSAMGKTTNALERVFEGVQRGDREKSAAEIARLREYHAAIIDDLWHGPSPVPRRSSPPHLPLRPAGGMPRRRYRPKRPCGAAA